MLPKMDAKLVGSGCQVGGVKAQLADVGDRGKHDTSLQTLQKNQRKGIKKGRKIQEIGEKKNKKN